jgi:hypothetical protein
MRGTSKALGTCMVHEVHPSVEDADSRFILLPLLKLRLAKVERIWFTD